MIIVRLNIVHIIDFSYNYNVPVLCAIVVNKSTHAVSVNLGAAPVFDIACERVLTELH
jgi:ribosomal protein S12 methylthiotransferase accessory factor YcaO